ncbi:cytochrome C551 [uncultured Chryseobacterium sp.]|uniref:cytochrome C551 n=1 Tax=uncultured Chryseobacterium sp. TaxID=259322 RepID=UPI00262630D1|nr:cytochrome C551 [uncultured Chryseobacterium sp.]
MKKLLFIVFGLGILTVSCGSKESSMSTASSDSTAIDSTAYVAPMTTDTTSTRMNNPDSIKIDIDSAATTPVK